MSQQRQPISARYTKSSGNTYVDLRTRILHKLRAELEGIGGRSEAEMRQHVEDLYNNILADESMVLSRAERRNLLEALYDDLFGFGPLERLMHDPLISEILVNGPKIVYIRMKGEMVRANITFDDDDHVLQVLRRILQPTDIVASPTTPMIDVRLPDGTRVNAVVRPIALGGTTLTVLKTGQGGQSATGFTGLPADVRQFLTEAVQKKANILISGNMGSGKTTLLNDLLSFVAAEDRLVIVEHGSEIEVELTNDLRLGLIDEAENGLPLELLVQAGIAMQPDRLIVGEIAGGEALEWLEAVNRGYRGCMATILGNDPAGALHLLETYCSPTLPPQATREAISSAVDLVVHQARLPDGTRRITQICEVGDPTEIGLNLIPIFTFTQTGVENGRILGQLQRVGIQTRF